MNALQREFSRMTTKRQGGAAYYFFHARGGDFHIYDERLNFYGAWMNPEAFLLAVKAGQELILQENTL